MTKTKSLCVLTNGFFDDLSELSVPRIESYFRQKTGQMELVIPQGNLAPLFKADGTPLSTKKGKPLCLPYTHACVFAYAMMEEAGREKARNTEEVKDLPLPFWRSTDAYLVTSDRCVIVAQRSNFNQNAPGRCLFTAAGFAQIKEGVPETAFTGVQNRLEEEAGLSVKTEGSLQIVQFGRDFNNVINTYAISTNGVALEGRVPVIAEKYALFTKRHAREVLRSIQANGKNLGFMALPVKEIDRLLSSEKEKAQVLYAPDYDVLTRMTYKDGSGTLAARVKEGISLSSLRRELEAVIRPQDAQEGDVAQKDAAIRQMRSELGELIKVSVKRGDFAYGSVSPLTYMQRAALAVRPPQQG